MLMTEVSASVQSSTSSAWVTSVVFAGELVDLSQCEIHTVASLLKQFLRELQDSIFTAYLNPKFDEVASM